MKGKCKAGLRRKGRAGEQQSRLAEQGLGAESGADGSDRDVSGKRTDTMAALMVLSAQSLAQNRPRGPGLWSG